LLSAKLNNLTEKETLSPSFLAIGRELLYN